MVSSKSGDSVAPAVVIAYGLKCCGYEMEDGVTGNSGGSSRDEVEAF